MGSNQVVKMTHSKTRRGFHEQEAMKAIRGKRNKTQRGNRMEWSQ